MLRRLFIGPFVAGAAALLLASCSDASDTTPPGAGGAGAASSSVAGSTGNGGAGGTGGGSPCAGAVDIEFGEIVDGDLASTGQKDFYRFIGKKGQVVLIDVDAQSSDDADYDPTYIDSVVTLFNADGDQIAQNDDPIEYSTGDSRLYTILPADGEYCFRVADCWIAAPNPAQNCAGEKDKLATSYEVWLYELVDEPSDPNTEEVEAGDDAASATTIAYAKDSAGIYTTTLWGTFEDQDDIDVWSFTLPADFESPPGYRTSGSFFIMPSGPSQSGSTAPTGKVWVADAAAPDVALAQVDAGNNVRLFPLLKAGAPYLLFVTRPKGPTLENDFYFVRHYPSSGNPLEMETGTGTNDTPATAEALAPFPGEKNAVSFYVEGDLAMGAQDVDHFLAVASGQATVVATCAAQRAGSGLRGFTVSLLAADGSLLPNSIKVTEKETVNARVPPVPLGGATQVILKLEADSQDATVTQAFYRCGVHFTP